MRVMWFFLVLSFAGVLACAELRPKPEATRCPESQGLVCLTAQECSFDRERDCLVCQCSSAQNPPMLPPDATVPPR